MLRWTDAGSRPWPCRREPVDVATPLRTPAAAGNDQPAGDAAGVDVVEPRRSRALSRYLGRLVSLVATLAVVAIAAVAVALTLVPASWAVTR